MADYLVTDTELTSVANAIRTKGGTSASLSFPTGYVSAINAIPTGSTPSLQTKSKTYTPTTSQQTDTVTADSGYDGLDEVNITVNAMPTGEVTAPASASGTNPTMSAVTVGQVRKLQVTGTVSITPSVTTAGYVSSGTAGNTEVSFLTNATMKATASIKPSSSSQSISANTYIEGAQTFLPVICENLTAGNIKDGVTVKIGCATDDDSVMSVTGTYTGDGGGGGGGEGGASNFITGTFTTGSSAGVSSVSLAYTGSGYPLMAVIVIENGAYNSAVSPWYGSMQRYAVGQWTMTKSVFTSTPSYTTSGTQNQGVTTWVFKNSTSSSTSYSRSSAMNTNVYSSSNASNAGATCVRFKGNTTLSYYVNTSSYGLLPSTTYRYFIVYSS